MFLRLFSKAFTELDEVVADSSEYLFRAFFSDFTEHLGYEKVSFSVIHCTFPLAISFSAENPITHVYF